MKKRSLVFAQPLATIRRMGRLCNSALIASAAFTLTSCSDRTVEPIAAVTLEQAYEVEFPQEVGCWTDNDSVLCPLIIREDGTLTHKGDKIDPADSPRIEIEWRRRGFFVLGIAVHPSAQYDTVVERLFELEEVMPSATLSKEKTVPADQIADPMTGMRPPRLPPRFAFVEAEERYSKVGETRNLHAAAALIEREFSGDVGEYEYGVLVGHTGSYHPCAFKADGLTLSSRELNDLAFQRLERVVMRADIEDNLFEDALLVARIQADASTKWQCVGAAAYQLRKAGYPFLRFEVLPDQPQAGDVQTSG